MGDSLRSAIAVLVTLTLVSAPVGGAAATDAVGPGGGPAGPGATDGDATARDPAGSANRTANGSSGVSVVDRPRVRAGEAASAGSRPVRVDGGASDEAATEGRLQFDRTYDRPNLDAATAVLQTDDGGYLLAGRTETRRSVEHWFVRTDASGDREWDRTYGTDDHPDRVRDLIETDGGYVFVGSWGIDGGSRMVVGKIDDSGDTEWLVPVDDDGAPSEDVANSVLRTGDQRYLVAGEITPDGVGSQQAILFELDVSGTPSLAWSRTYGTDGLDRAAAVVEASGGGYAFAGRRNVDHDDRREPGTAWLVRVGPRGSERWETTFGNGSATDLLPRADGGYVVTGEGGTWGIGGERSPWVKRVDGDREVAWSRSPPYVSCSGTDLAPRAGGGVAVVGSTCTDVAMPEFFDGWIATYDPAGDRRFDASFGTAGYSSASAVVATDDGGYAVAGATDADTPTSAFWLTKFSGDGGDGDDGDGGDGDGTVSRIEFDYSEHGGSVNLEVDGTRKVVGNLAELDGERIERAVVHVPDPAGGAGSGHVRITGEIGSFSVGGQEFSVDNVTFAAGGREKTVRFDRLRPDRDAYPVGTSFTSVPTGVEMTVEPYVHSDGDRARDTSGSVSGGAYWAANTNLAFDVGSVFEGSPAPPEVVNRSVRIDPYPVATGERPTLRVNVTNASDGDDVFVRRWVNGTREGRVGLGHDGGTTWTGELPAVDGPGANVTLEVVARNGDGNDSLATFPGTDEHLGYFAFREVREVGVVLGAFPGETLPAELADRESLRTWQLATEVDVNHFYGSDRGSMGAVGFDLVYHANGSDLFAVDRTRSAYQAMNTADDPDAGAHQFMRDLRSAAGGDVRFGEYPFWVGVHPGTGGSNLIGGTEAAYYNPSGVLEGHHDRIYVPAEEGADTWNHEVGHALGFDHVSGGFTARAMMAPTTRGDSRFSVATRVGDNGGVGWLSKDVTEFGDVPDSGRNLSVPAVAGYDLGDSVPTVRVGRWFGVSTTDFTIGVREPDVLGLPGEVNVYRGNSVLENESLDVEGDSVMDRLGVVDPTCVEFTLVGEDDGGEVYESTVEVEPVACGRSVVFATLRDATTVDWSGDVVFSGDDAARPDLDLRAVDAEGRVTGVTESGEFVDRIPGARASGDRDGLEWIAVPENASVRFVVTSADLRRFVRRTGAARENVTPAYDLSVTRYGDDPEVATGPDGNRTVGDTATTVSRNRTVAVGANVTTSPPVADAGPDREAGPGGTVELDGSGSTDPAGDALTYRWTQTGGPDVSLADPDAATPTFTAPDVDEERTLTFRLAVDDGATTATDTVTVTVTPAEGPIERIDEDGDGVVDDGELSAAVRLWVEGRLSDSALRVILRAWVTGG